MSNKKTLSEQINDVIVKGNEPIDTKALGDEVKMKQEQLADAIDASIDPVERAAETAALDLNVLEERVTALMMAAHHTFFDPEQRQEGDNGYFYSLDYDGWDSRTDGAQPTGRIVTVDRLGFLGGGVARGICNAFEFMLNGKNGQRARSNKLRADIQRTLSFGHTTGNDMSRDLANLERSLANSVEQEALIEIALHKAAECYHALTGRFYQTAQEREASATKAVKSLDPAQADRLKKLGVTI